MWPLQIVAEPAPGHRPVIRDQYARYASRLPGSFAVTPTDQLAILWPRRHKVRFMESRQLGLSLIHI